MRSVIFEYVVRNNDLSGAADRCHSILSNASLAPATRCEMALECARSLVALITVGSEELWKKAVEAVERCVAARARGAEGDGLEPAPDFLLLFLSF